MYICVNFLYFYIFNVVIYLFLYINKEKVSTLLVPVCESICRSLWCAKVCDCSCMQRWIFVSAVVPDVCVESAVYLQCCYGYILRGAN